MSIHIKSTAATPGYTSTADLTHVTSLSAPAAGVRPGALAGEARKYGARADDPYHAWLRNT